jgi:sirohydrochlorin cobaltochelatase
MIRELKMRRTAMLLSVLILGTPTLSAAQNSGSTVGTIVIAHGGGPAWDAQVVEVVKQVKTGGPVEVSFLMGPGAATARFQDAARKLVEAGAQRIVVVPMLVSSHSGHYEQIRYLAGEVDSLDHTMMHHLHMSGIERAAVKVPIRVAKAIDDAPYAARVIAERARALSTAPQQQALFIVGHGPNSAEDNAAWMENLRIVADSVRAATSFRDVRVGLVRDDAPAPVRAEAVRGVRELIELQHALTNQTVVVVPVLISKGSVSTQKIPADLAGLPIVYTGDTLLPHPLMARHIEERVRALVGSTAAHAR